MTNFKFVPIILIWSEHTMISRNCQKLHHYKEIRSIFKKHYPKLMRDARVKALDLKCGNHECMCRSDLQLFPGSSWFNSPSTLEQTKRKPNGSNQLHIQLHSHLHCKKIKGSYKKFGFYDFDIAHYYCLLIKKLSLVFMYTRARILIHYTLFYHSRFQYNM